MQHPKDQKFQVKIRSKEDTKRKTHLWAIFGSAVLCFALLVSSLWFVGDYYLHRPLHEIEEPSDGEATSKNENVAATDEIRQKQINILVAGIDSGDSRSTNLTDVLMVVNIDLVNKKINILQIPRDTYVDEAVWTGKINAVYNVGNRDAYGRGINGLLNCISDKFKIHLDYYAMVNLQGFRDIIEVMGGVKITFDEAFTLRVDEKDWYFPAGEQVLTPKQAEIFVRERNSRGGDLGRVQKGQRVLMAALIRQVKNMSKTEILGLIPTLLEYCRTDMSLADAMDLAGAVLDIDTSKITFDMVPGEGVYVKGQSCYTVHLEPLTKIINEKFRANMDPIQSSDLGLIEVRNTTNSFDNGGSTVDEVDG